MTAKEVLQKIEKQREEAGIAFLGHIYLEVPEYWEVIEALEKQIQKEHHHTRVVEVKCKARESVCPACLGVTITAENEYPKHCTWCGQALDWSDYDSKDENDYKYLVDARVVKRCVNDKAFEILSTEQQGNNDKEDNNG